MVLKDFVDKLKNIKKSRIKIEEGAWIKCDKCKNILYIEDLLKNLKIIYFKSKVGRIVKFETTIPLAVNVLYDYFILEGENILTYIVDRNAKDVMAMPSRYAHLLNFPWKYRL